MLDQWLNQIITTSESHPHEILQHQTARSITAQIKKEGTFLTLAIGRIAVLYLIKEEQNALRIYLARKNGMKFKRTFHNLTDQIEPSVRSWAGWWLKRYLERCCVVCKGRGWAYKLRFPPQFRSRIHGGPTRRFAYALSIATGIELTCPECRAVHGMRWEERTIIYGDAGQTYQSKEPVFFLKE